MWVYIFVMVVDNMFCHESRYVLCSLQNVVSISAMQSAHCRWKRFPTVWPDRCRDWGVCPLKPPVTPRSSSQRPCTQKRRETSMRTRWFHVCNFPQRCAILNQNSHCMAPAGDSLFTSYFFLNKWYLSILSLPQKLFEKHTSFSYWLPKKKNPFQNETILDERWEAKAAIRVSLNWL